MSPKEKSCGHDVLAESTPLVSIVIPVYNVIDYLDACLQSVVDQSYHSLQIVLVDDGSTDGCHDRCDWWGNADDRIEVLHKANSGLSAARNAGMRLVKGDFCLFVDSDDLLGRNHVSNLIAGLEASDDPSTTVVVTGFTPIGCTSDCSIAPASATSRGVVSAAEAISTSVNIGGHFGAHAWGKLYPRALYNLLEYPVGRCYEDQFVMYKVFLAASTIVYEDANDYLYRQGRPGSITCQDRSRALDYLDAIRITLHDVTMQCPEAAPAVRTRYLGVLVRSLEHARAARLPERYDELYIEARGISRGLAGFDALPKAMKLRFRALVLGKRMYAHLIDGKLVLERMREHAAGETRQGRSNQHGCN